MALRKSIRLGYVHANTNPDTSLHAYLTNTTNARFISPGDEVYYINRGGKHSNVMVYSILVGARVYAIVGQMHDIIHLLREHAPKQTVEVEWQQDWAGGQAYGHPHGKHGLSAQEKEIFKTHEVYRRISTHVYANVSKVQPSTIYYFRQWIAESGAALAPLGEGAFAGVKFCKDIADFGSKIAEAAGIELFAKARAAVASSPVFERVTDDQGTRMIVELSALPLQKWGNASEHRIVTIDRHFKSGVTFAEIGEALEEYESQGIGSLKEQGPLKHDPGQQKWGRTTPSASTLRGRSAGWQRGV